MKIELKNVSKVYTTLESFHVKECGITGKPYDVFTKVIHAETTDGERVTLSLEAHDFNASDYTADDPYEFCHVPAAEQKEQLSLTRVTPKKMFKLSRGYSV